MKRLSRVAINDWGVYVGFEGGETEWEIFIGREVCRCSITYSARRSVTSSWLYLCHCCRWWQRAWRPFFAHSKRERIVASSCRFRTGLWRCKWGSERNCRWIGGTSRCEGTWCSRLWSRGDGGEHEELRQFKHTLKDENAAFQSARATEKAAHAEKIWNWPC